MVDAPDWFVWIFDLILFALIFVGAVYLRGWLNVKRTKGKMIAEIWEPNGDTSRNPVTPDPTGATVTVDNLVYRLPKEPGEKEKDKTKKNPDAHIYPTKRWTSRSNWPLPPIPLRIESWERDNPEPIRPFYGRVMSDGKFEDSQLTVTGSEWQAQKSVIQATGIAMSVQEREAREKEWQRAMANLPNKMIVYLGIGMAVLFSAITVMLIYQL